MTPDPKKKARPTDADAPNSPDPGKGANDDEQSDADEQIEIVDFAAADESGVLLEEESDEDVEAIVIDDEADEEFDVDVDMGAGAGVGNEAFDTSSRRAAGENAALTVEVAAARAQVQELREQLLRTTADFDNFRKRVDRDRVDERKQATAGVVRGLLPVLDSFRWALGSAGAGEDAAVKAFAEGFKIIETQLLEVLKAAGLEPVDAMGIFDPTVHEALMQETTTDKPHMTVLEVFEPGWRLGGRLLRPARVKVANNPSGSPAPESPESGDSADDSNASENEPATTL